MRIEFADHEEFQRVPAIANVLLDLAKRGEVALRDFCTNQFAETLHLEFKQKKNPQTASLDGDDKQNAGKLASAFSNSDGGVVIWGIATTKVDSFDVATESKPIADFEKFEANLVGYCDSVLSPENTGIRFFSIAQVGNPNFGHVVMLVPRGPSRPHMSNASEHKKYFKKTTQGTYPLEHFEVADLFSTRTSPILKLRWRIRHNSSNGSGLDGFLLDLFFDNAGFVVAKEPYAIIDDWPKNFNASGVGRQLRLDPPEFGNRALLMSSNLETLMPGDRQPFLQIEFFRKLWGGSGNLFWGRPPSIRDSFTPPILTDTSFSVTVGALNAAPLHVQLLIAKSIFWNLCAEKVGNAELNDVEYTR